MTVGQNEPAAYLVGTEQIEVAEARARSRTFIAPLSGATRGRLEIVSGISRVTITADAALPELLHARFQGQIPGTSSSNGAVTIRYPRHSVVAWVKDLLEPDSAATITLNGVITWRIDIDGGASKLSADLGGVQLGGLRIGGGASQIAVMLPQPVGVVPVSFGGGISRVTIYRPQGVSARLHVRGGASDLTFDQQHVDAVGGEVRWHSADFNSASDRYEIEVAGGASELKINVK